MITNDLRDEVRGTVIDRWQRRRFDRSLFRKCGSICLDNMGNLRALDQIGAALEELTWCTGDAGLSNGLGIHFGMVSQIICEYGTLEVKSEWAQGLKEGTAVGAFAVTESGAGSDLAKLEVGLVKNGHDYRLSGRKWMVSLAPVASAVLVVAVYGQDLAVVLVPLDQESVNISEVDVLSIRTCPVGTISFSDTYVPASNILATGREARNLLRRIIDIDRAIVWRYRIGRLQSVIDLVTAYGHQRSQGAERLFEHESYRHKLAELFAEFTSCREIMLKAGRLITDNDPEGSRIAAIARLMTGRSSTEASRYLIDMLGARSVITGGLAHMYIADSGLDIMGGGTENILKEKIARFAHSSSVPSFVDGYVSGLLATQVDS